MTYDPKGFRVGEFVPVLLDIYPARLVTPDDPFPPMVATITAVNKDGITIRYPHPQSTK